MWTTVESKKTSLQEWIRWSKNDVNMHTLYKDNPCHNSKKCFNFHKCIFKCRNSIQTKTCFRNEHYPPVNSKKCMFIFKVLRNLKGIKIKFITTSFDVTKMIFHVNNEKPLTNNVFRLAFSHNLKTKKKMLKVIWLFPR